MPDFLDSGFDSLALADAEGTRSHLMDATFEFGEWCNTVIWAPDSRSVGFLISDTRLAVYDVTTRVMRAYFYLAGSGCCGGPQESRNVAFSADGTQVSFDRFDRPIVRIRDKRGKEFDRRITSQSPPAVLRLPLVAPARNLGRETIRVPTSHIRLRLLPVRDRPLPASVEVGVVVANRRIQLDAPRGVDGIFTLPPVFDGPIDRLEIWDGQPGKRIMVRGARGDQPPTTVDLAADEEPLGASRH